MTEGEAMLLHICRHPDDIDARMVYADWLDEHDELERGEFIRIQCEDARLHVCDCAPSLFVLPGCPVCTGVKPLRQRACKLLLGMTDDFRPVVNYSWAVLDRMPDGDTPGSWVRRGFVEVVRCTLEDWLAHGGEIVLAHPVREVRLTDKRPVNFGPTATSAWRWHAYQSRHFLSGAYPEDYSELPKEVYAVLGGTPHAHFDSHDACVRGLSAACILYARKQAGLEAPCDLCIRAALDAGHMREGGYLPMRPDCSVCGGSGWVVASG